MMNELLAGVLAENGIELSDVEMVSGTMKDISNGYVIKVRKILSGGVDRVVEILPNVEWTDGTIRPIYGGSWKSSNVSVYLNKK